MKQKKFDEFVSQECEGCEHYWNGDCDGYVIDEHGNRCKSYQPTEMSYLEDQIDRIERNQLLTTIVLVLIGLAEVMEIIGRFW